MKAELKSRSQINAAAWDELVSSSPQGMFYSLTGYLDIVSPGWMGIEVADGKGLAAVMPLPVSQKMGLSYSLQPAFCQYLGISFAGHSFNSNANELSWKRKVVMAITDAVPLKLKYIILNFSPGFDYPFPFHWKGYRLGLRFSYHVNLDQSENDLLENMDSATRNFIRKDDFPMDGFSENGNIQSMMELVNENERAGKAILNINEKSLFTKIWPFLVKNCQGRCIEAIDEKGKIAGSVAICSFNDTTVLLMTALKPEFRKSSVMNKLIWHALISGKKNSRIFDFEGSMIEGIEAFFRGFGGRPVPYSYIHKNDLPLFLRWIKK